MRIHSLVNVPGIGAGVNLSIGLPVMHGREDQCAGFDIAVIKLTDERSPPELQAHVADVAPRGGGGALPPSEI